MQNFEPTGAAAAMPGSAVPQIKRRLVISACLLIPLFYLGLGAAFGLPLPPFLTGDNAMWCGIVQLVLTVPVCWLNRSYFINGCKSIRAPGPDTLVALSSGAALVYGIIAIFTQDAPQELFLPSAAAILIFAAACQLLEVRFKAQAMAPLHSLAERIPETACVLRSRQQHTVPLNEVAVGDIFLIRPGDVMPVDGVVIEGETTVDESALTGAAAPVAKHKGSTVYAATANQSGALICRATRIGPDSTAAQLVHTVQTTAAAKVPLSSLADKVRSVFVPAVIGIACVVLIIWLLLGQSFAFALARAISVLAVSSPCVLALAASAAIMSGASVGAKHGIVFKTAASLQSIGTLHTAVLDKAGTITNGEPEVVTIVGTRSVPAKFLLGMAAGLESQSQDPLARAVMRKAAAENIKLSAVKDVTILDGQGLTGKMAGKVMAGGSAEFIAAQCELTPDLQQAGEQLAADGIAPLYFSLDGHAAGLIGIADAVKPASKAALDALKALGLDVILLTGDSRTNADRVAAQVGLDDAHVVSGLAPAELEAELRRLQTNGPAAMIGSTSAAAALACADVGIGMGAEPLPAADVMLLRDDLADAAAAVRISRAVDARIAQNTRMALVYSALLPLLAAGVLYPLNFVLHPIDSVILMTLFVAWLLSGTARLNSIDPKPASQSEPQKEPAEGARRMSAAVERRHWHFTGSVQGVGFRYRAQYAAQLLDLTGWVENNWDGTVDLEAQGSAAQLDRLVPTITGTSHWIHIETFTCKSIPPDPAERSFRVRG